jgi:hypothetical protein
LSLLDSLREINELCPNCGNFVDSLNDVTGFCGSCSGVGEFTQSPTPNDKALRLELWLTEKSDIIESVMLTDRVTAKVAIKKLAQDSVPRCQCCNEPMPHTTAGRHIFCSKNDKCKKARRYYKYLVYEKGIDKDEARNTALERFKE